MGEIKVLISDDSRVVRNGLHSILRAYPDIEVVGEAVDGLDAIAKAEQLRPNIILMDGQMPEMDGIEATRCIKERFPSIKILFLTVHIGFIEGALAAGADCYLTKDCNRHELLEVIRDLGHRGLKLMSIDVQKPVDQQRTLEIRGEYFTNRYDRTDAANGT